MTVHRANRSPQLIAPVQVVANVLKCIYTTGFVFQDDVTKRLPAEQAIPQIAASGQVAADATRVHCAQLAAGRLDAALAIRTAAP